MPRQNKLVLRDTPTRSLVCSVNLPSETPNNLTEEY